MLIVGSLYLFIAVPGNSRYYGFKFSGSAVGLIWDSIKFKSSKAQKLKSCEIESAGGGEGCGAGWRIHCGMY
jgi:hypothetical protein